MKAIIRSILDNDLYKFTMMQAVREIYPDLDVEYSFTNRGKTPFPLGFARALRSEIRAMANIRLTDEEEAYLRTSPDLRFLKSAFIDYLKSYRFDPREVTVTEKNGAIIITIRGSWLRTILWEVPLLAIVSELYFRSTNQPADMDVFAANLAHKQNRLMSAGCKFADFGTRRRYSFEIQNELVRSMKENCGANFLGTSNVYLAMKHRVKPIGTHAHEWFMAHQSMFGASRANELSLETWYDVYKGSLGIALSDTFTSDVFFRDFNLSLSTRYAGVRQDSGDPIAFGEKAIAHYAALGIDPLTKTIVFSDALDDEKAAELQRIFGGRIKVVFGIGTFFTNDVGVTPLNIVIKLARALVTGKWIVTVKLSDSHGKWNGDLDSVDCVCHELGLPSVK